MNSHSTEKRPLTPSAQAPFLHHAAAAAVEAKRWRRGFWGVTLIALVALGDIAYLSGKILVLPYVVRITDNQMVGNVGTIPSTFDAGKEPQVVDYLLRQWLLRVRGITTDPVAWDKQWTEAHAFMGQKAIGMVAEFKQQQKKRGELGKAVTVEVLHSQAVAGTQGRTWEMDWNEKAYSQQGYPLSAESGTWHATVKVAQLPTKPLTTLADYANPLRVFVEEVSWNQRLMKGQP